ncbi:hypothetical protein A2Z22_00010 [Candidatus Woesebacteria bacterium RBG_16_34_12]|uniref:Uncharacterized protein n=1 Tax=Candidatus Woesebacteria bacterium RBG_16_34_12 TaxID=1802480 RepID=A0A1F7X6L2_9BACT|nr:MAG: hypothetical protein A2Z22_00010 [Candidatus Woesebacteria bacterium RBG_16_34_12]
MENPMSIEPIVSVIVRPPLSPSLLLQLIYKPFPDEEEENYWVICQESIRNECNEDKVIEEWTAPIPPVVAAEVINLLKDSLIPPISKSQLTEVDGCSYEVYFGDAFSSAHYQWWLSPPEEWEPLAEVVDMLLGCSGIYL